MERINFVSERNLTVNDFGRVCRTCLSTVDLQPMSDVFNIGYFPVEVALNKYTQIQFDPTDNLPKQMCSNCVRNLNSSYNFLLHCDSVNMTLKKCLARHERKLQSNVGLPKEIEYVNCEVKKEFETFENEINECDMTPPPLQPDKLHTAIQIKEEVLDNSEDENDSDNFDSDGEPIITKVKHNKRKALKKRPDAHMQDDMKRKKRILPENCSYEIGESENVNRTPLFTKDGIEMNEESNLIPEEILTKTVKSNESLLPERSKEMYDKEYDRFQIWMMDNSVTNINEALLLGYFEELSESFTPNSLWTKYSMLKKTLLVNKNVNIGEFNKLGEYLKEKAKGYEGKKSKILTREQVLKFVQEAPNQTFLMAKVALLFGVYGGCRRQELVNMSVDHVEDRNSVIVVNVLGNKTGKKRVFTIIDENQMGSLKLIREYTSLRPQMCSVKRFFLNYRNGRCTTQPVGKNTFGKIPTTIATYLKLSNPDEYTGHCLRRTFATLLAGSGTSMSTLNRYEEDSISSKNKISKMLAGVPSISTNCFQSVFVDKDECSSSVTFIGSKEKK